MPDIQIPKYEKGVTRVFSLSMTAQEARKLRDDAQIRQTLLGGTDLDPRGVEVFALADLGEIGLSGYLRDGADAQEADLRRDAAKLAALDGWVMLIHSSAFRDQKVTLHPAPALTLVGTYAQHQVARTETQLESDAAQLYTGQHAAPAPTDPRAGAGSMWVVLVLAVIIGAGLWWVLG